MYRNRSKDDATGDYINYLRMGNIIFLPIFNRKEDERVISKFENEIFKGIKIVPVLATDLWKDGGIIHCVSWGILSDTIGSNDI